MTNAKKIDTAMILAAGFGTRMRPLTLETPKPLLAVGGAPLIEWHIYAIKAAGIDNIVINCAWLAEKLMAHIGDGSQYGVNISWSQEKEALETAGGIKQALPLIGNKPFLLVNGDVWTTANYQKIIESADKANAKAYLCLVDNPEHNPTGDFLLEGFQVKTKPYKEAMGNTFAGISVLDPELFNEIETGVKAPLAPILVSAMQEKTAFGEKLDCQWVDVGTPERLTVLDDQIKTEGASQHPAWTFIQNKN